MRDEFFSILKYIQICQISQRQKWPPVQLYFAYQYTGVGRVAVRRFKFTESLKKV